MFNGSLVALITPFKNGAVDEKSFEKFVAWQIKEGTDGLVPCGTTGESPTLSMEEHKRVIDICIAAAKGSGVPVIAQNVSAIPEVVGPGGILLEPKATLTVPSGEDVWLADIEAFSSALEQLYSSAGARRQLGEAGREHVKKFSWDFATARFDEYVRNLGAAAQETPTQEA